MDKYMPTIIEIAVLLGVFLAANLFTRPLQKRRHHARTADGGVRGFGALFAFVAQSLAMLAFSFPVVWLLRLNAPAAAWLAENAVHVSAWQLFWLILLAMNLIEGLLYQWFALQRRTFPLPDLLAAFLRAALYLFTAFMVLKIALGVNLAPLLASTALVTAVIGFALQGVLGNLLAGMSLHIVRSMLPSDWVAIGDVEGRVISTNWRETRLRTRDGQNLIIPNSQVSTSIIHNMSQPNTMRRHRLNVGASYSDAPEDVIAAMEEAANAVPDVLKRPAPAAYVTEFQDYGINYQLLFWTNKYYKRLPIEGDVNRMIWYKFKRRGIEIPFPMSDKLLNDFMAVVYKQRKMQPEERELESTARDLLTSDFNTRFCVDENGDPLLQPGDFAQLAPLVKRRLYTRGELICEQGAEGSDCYVLVRGGLRGRIRQEGDLPPVEFEIAPGAVFGEMSLMTRMPRTADIEALEESELIEIDEAAFARLLSLHEEIPEKLAAVAAARAEENRATFEKLRKTQPERLDESLERKSILRRFMKLIGRK